MSELLESTTDIREALGDAYRLFKRFDILPVERAKTDQFRRELLRRYCSCASCGWGIRPNYLEAHHIRPLEEGGCTTLDNLVLLCPHCHELCHEGYASMAEIDQTAASWRSGRVCNLKEVMLTRQRKAQAQQLSLRPIVDTKCLADNSSVYVYQQMRQWINTRRVLAAAIKSSTSEECQQVLTIGMANNERRRAARGAVETASCLLENLNTQAIPLVRLPLYYYELGYVKLLLGMALEASEYFLKSQEYASRLEDEYAPLEALIAEAQYLATQIIAMPLGPSPPLSTLPDVVASTITRLDRVAEKAEKIDEMWGGRWQLNCKMFKVNLLVKCGYPGMASLCFEEASELRRRQNVTTGWTKDSGATMTAMEGLLVNYDPSEEETHDGLRLLARVLVSLLDGRRQRPEGIRDKLLGFEKGLRSLTECRGADVQQLREFADEISNVRVRIRDGSSFLDSYQRRA